MTRLLEKAFKKMSRLPEIEQNALARWILDEIDSEKMWDKKFAESEDALAKLALEALEEDEQGKAVNLDIDEL